MFGRNKKADDDIEVVEDATDEDEIKATETDDSEPGDGEAEEAESEVEPAEPDGASDGESDDEPDDEPEDEWLILDESKDWREDGPFDITEVDLGADKVQRLDFGSLVVTPFDGMQLQMQINQATEQVQALLVVNDESAIEVALFAAPARSSMLAEVRADMASATEVAGGTMKLVEGPLGTEIRRVLPATTPEGKEVKQRSRTWLVQGPRWMLRGVLMGKVAQDAKADDTLMYEFFCNLVVRRGDTPHVPGDLIPLEIPAAIAADLAKKKGDA